MQVIPYIPHPIPMGPLYLDELGYYHPVEDVNNVSNEYLDDDPNSNPDSSDGDMDDSDSSSSSHGSHHPPPPSEASELDGYPNHTPKSFRSVHSDKGSGIATASPSAPTRAFQLDVTASPIRHLWESDRTVRITTRL